MLLISLAITTAILAAVGTLFAWLTYQQVSRNKASPEALTKIDAIQIWRAETDTLSPPNSITHEIGGHASLSPPYASTAPA